MRTRIKICGITRMQDLQTAVQGGADALGFVFHRHSPRALELAAARSLFQATPAFVCRVALFMNDPEDWIREVLAELPVDLLQFHGEEPPQFCTAYARPYLKAISMAGHADIAAVAKAHVDSRALLLDGHAMGEQGGSGQRFDWSRIPAGLKQPVILAGGLTPDNVAEAVRRVRPYGVDVSSGVEASKGLKDPAKLSAFFAEVHRADQN